MSNSKIEKTERQSAFEKLGQERWDALLSLRGAIKELTLDNDLEDTVVFLCHEVVRRDNLFQEVVDQIRELDGCSCEKCEEEEK